MPEFEPRYSGQSNLNIETNVGWGASLEGHTLFTNVQQKETDSGGNAENARAGLLLKMDSGTLIIAT